MADEATNLIFEYLRRLDTKFDRVIEEVADLKGRITTLEERMARTEIAIGNLELSIAGVNAVSTASKIRFDRIERRLDLVDHPH